MASPQHKKRAIHCFSKGPHKASLKPCLEQPDALGFREVGGGGLNCEVGGGGVELRIS